jgi:hypothetical protein
MKESEAKNKWCPFARVHTGMGGSTSAANRGRTLYIVELPNGNWPEITRDEWRAKEALAYWKRFGALLLRITVPLAQDIVSTH